MQTAPSIALGGVLFALALTGAQAQPTVPRGCEFSDSHFHLTNYIQEGISPQQFLAIMGERVCRSTLFGIPLQQQWSHRVTGDIAPTYYLDSDADLYYYSFTDAQIAVAYRSLTPQQQARFDPMITGFNPTDMYAADHIRRVLQTFPGVFTGIGEFTIHKEFVSSKVAGDVASLTDPALDRILEFAAEAGLVVILHNDVAMPFPSPDKAAQYVTQLTDVFRRHPRAQIIWAHVGVGRIVQPLPQHMQLVEGIVADPALAHVHFDISWDEVAKYMVATEQSTQRAADVLNRHTTRFLFGTDTVAPATAEKYYGVFDKYAPVLARLTPEARTQLLTGNYARLFDAARRRVRAWEAANPARPRGSDGSPASGVRSIE
jgi:predicted TIM-barrel fold metal-dependent hydrolase